MSTEPAYPSSRFVGGSKDGTTETTRRVPWDLRPEHDGEPYAQVIDLSGQRADNYTLVGTDPDGTLVYQHEE